MRGINYMILSRESVEEIIEEHGKRNHGWKDVKVTFQQRKHHNVTMFEVKLVPEKHEGNNPDEE